MDAKVMKEMLGNTGGLRSEFTSVSVHYSGRTYSATFSFRPILILISYRGFHATISDGTASVYSYDRGNLSLIMQNVSWSDTGISFQVINDINTMAYFWGIG